MQQVCGKDFDEKLHGITKVFESSVLHPAEGSFWFSKYIRKLLDVNP